MNPMVSLKEGNITCLSLAFLICEMAKALITSKSMIYGMIFSLGVICNQCTHLPLSSAHSPMNSHLGSFQRLLTGLSPAQLSSLHKLSHTWLSCRQTFHTQQVGVKLACPRIHYKPLNPRSSAACHHAFPIVCALSHSVVSNSATPWACQAPLSVGFSKQEYWSGLLFPSPGIKPESPATTSATLTLFPTCLSSNPPPPPPSPLPLPFFPFLLLFLLLHVPCICSFVRSNIFTEDWLSEHFVRSRSSDEPNQRSSK